LPDSFAAQGTSGGARLSVSAATLLMPGVKAQVAPDATGAQFTNNTTRIITRSTVVVSQDSPDRKPAV